MKKAKKAVPCPIENPDYGKEYTLNGKAYKVTDLTAQQKKFFHEIFDLQAKKVKNTEEILRIEGVINYIGKLLGEILPKNPAPVAVPPAVVPPK